LARYRDHDHQLDQRETLVQLSDYHLEAY